MLQKTIFRFQPFLAFLLAKKQSKLIENQENRLNLNRLITFSEVWYVDAFQHKQMLQNNFFDFIIFWSFLAKKQPKLSKN